MADTSAPPVRRYNISYELANGVTGVSIIAACDAQDAVQLLGEELFDAEDGACPTFRVTAITARGLSE